MTTAEKLAGLVQAYVKQQSELHPKHPLPPLKRETAAVALAAEDIDAGEVEMPETPRLANRLVAEYDLRVREGTYDHRPASKLR